MNGKVVLAGIVCLGLIILVIVLFWKQRYNMSKKSEEKLAKLKEGICPFCGYDCHDKESLDRHIDWAHKKEVLS